MPKFSQFDGKGCPRQHLLCFTSFMGNYAYHSNFYFRLYPNSLTGETFQWYMTLPAGSVKAWEDMQALFLARFFVTTRDVNIGDLSSLRQGENEPVDLYIER